MVSPLPLVLSAVVAEAVVLLLLSAEETFFLKTRINCCTSDAFHLSNKRLVWSACARPSLPRRVRFLRLLTTVVLEFFGPELEQSQQLVMGCVRWLPI